jgi:DNA-binding response OmpR family regulator
MRKKIIVVEDDPDILFTVKMALENHNYQVAALSSAKIIMETPFELPDLFLLDKRMPEIDGLDVCRYLRGKTETANIPIIIMSATPKFGSESLLAGANGFLTKPFSLKDLLEIVAKHIG